MIELEINKVLSQNLLTAMAMLALTGREKRLFLQRMSKYVADQTRQNQRNQTDYLGRKIRRKPRASDFEGHEWGDGTPGLYFGRKTKTKKLLFEKLFRNKNLKITKPKDDSVKLYFRQGQEKKVKKGDLKPTETQGHIGAVAAMHHFGMPYSYWETPWPNKTQWSKISDLYKRIKGPLRMKLELKKRSKMVTVRQALFLVRSGIVKDKTPLDIFKFATQILYDNEVSKAKMKGILPLKEKISNKMSPRPLLMLNDSQMTTLADFVIKNLAESYSAAKRMPILDLSVK